MEENIKSIIICSDWNTLIQQYSSKDLAVALSFEKGMEVADAIFTWDHRHDEVINYVIDMFNAIRVQYPEKWNLDWKNDLYVNILCVIVLRYSEIYESCKRIHERLLPDPPSLVLFSLARCYFFPPEVDTISPDEAINLFKKSIEKELTYEAAFLLSEIYSDRKDEVNVKSWRIVAEEAKRKNLHIPVIIPDVFRKNEKG
jgi:hypothetical protein